MPVTQLSEDEWLVEIVDPMTRENGQHHLTAQFMVRVDYDGVYVRPWRTVNVTTGIAYPLPDSPETVTAYQSLVLLELTVPLVKLWKPVETATATQDGGMSADEATKLLLGEWS